MSDKRIGVFTPISLNAYVGLHLKSNPGSSREEIREALVYSLRSFKRGDRCECGRSIWVIGSAVAGDGCFACITGDSTPDEDYELEEAMKSGGK